MKKIIIASVLLAFSSISASAVDFSLFSVTGGIASNSGVFGASATETNDDDSGVVKHTKKESGVFTDSYQSTFVELGVGRFISLGYEQIDDTLSTPTNTTRHGTAVEANVSVDSKDVNMTYVKLNIPGGLYFKAGSMETDLAIKKTGGGTRKYANKSVSGEILGAGYSRFLGESGFGLRVEGLYMDLDNVSTDNGVATASASNGGTNKVDAKNLEGLSAKIAITYTLGRNN